MITLRGMTWNHPRGIDPLVAHARGYEEQHGMRIDWDARSLEDFEAFPLDELASRYDLMVIDHPHVGMAAASGCLLPLDTAGRDAELKALAGQTVGGSHETYYFHGHQWALAIDAAAQVAARRADLLPRWPQHLGEVVALAEEGRVLVPLAPVHALMCFFTLCANGRRPCATEGRQLVEQKIGVDVLHQLKTIAQWVPAFCFDSNPIAIYERMLQEDRYLYCPLIYGYVSYACGHSMGGRIDFGDIPIFSNLLPVGSTLGGTGIAVSARSSNREAAVNLAFDLASADVQRGIYAGNGGQPAHRDAWTDGPVNIRSHSFYRNTIATLDASYVRPRFDGYIAFQSRAGEIVQEALRGERDAATAVDKINQLFCEAQKR